MENEVLERTPVKETNKTKKLIIILSTLVVFVGLIVLAIVVFKQPVKVKFNAPGNLGFSLESAVADENGKIQVPDEKLLQKDHYVFLGWFKNAEGKGEALDLANMTFTESMDVYAIWDVIEYKITYDLDGGKLLDDLKNPEFYNVSHDRLTKSDNENNDKIWQLNATQLNSFIQEPGLRLNAPQKAGATFNGWQIIDEKGNVVTGVTVSTIRLNPIGNITLKALWA